MIFNKQFLLCIFLHILHGFVFEKSKLYYPYTFGRNMLLMKADLYKFYLGISFVFLSTPYVLNKFASAKYISARSYIENRYKYRDPTHVYVGSYLLGLSMTLTGFCPSYLPIYLALNPILFLYSIGAYFAAFIFCFTFGHQIFNKISTRQINDSINNSSSIDNSKETLCNIGRLVILSAGIAVLLLLETCEQSIPSGHTTDELIDLLADGDYLPPSLSGIICGFIMFCLIFICNEYQALTNDWLLNLFYYTSEIQFEKTNITGQLCIEQLLKIFAMAFGVRLSLSMSRRKELPKIDWLFYLLAGCGSFIGGFSICLTSGTFNDHVYLTNAFLGNISYDIVTWTVGSGWSLSVLSKLLRLSNLR